MATVTGMTAAAMQEIADASVVSGEVNTSGDLILTTNGGVAVNAGHVKGEKGDNATAKLLPADTDTVDLSMTGTGTIPDPWILKADVIIPAVEKTRLTLTLMDSVTGGWYVKGDDGVTYGPFSYSRSYTPIPGDKVWVNRNGFGGHVIDGAPMDWKPLDTTIRTYGANNADNQWNNLEYAVRNGFCAIRGLMAFTSGASLQLVATLPPGARPETDMLIKVNNSDVIKSATVQADGKIITGGVTINGFYAFDGTMFPVAGRAAWTYVDDAGSGLAFANGWTHYNGGTSAFGKVGFWRDEYDFVWMRGLIAGGTTAANVQMVNITNPLFLPWSGITNPSAIGGEQHNVNVNTDVIGALNIVGGTINSVRAGGGITSSSGWISLFGHHYLTDAAYTHPDWYEHPAERGWTSGWATYAAGYPTFAFRQRGDGMVATKGLIRAGTMGRMDYLPDSFQSERNLLLSSVANGAYSRFDIWGRRQTNQIGGAGVISPNSGSNIWFSLDNAHWFP